MFLVFYPSGRSEQTTHGIGPSVVEVKALDVRLPASDMLKKSFNALTIDPLPSAFYIRHHCMLRGHRGSWQVVYARFERQG
jgi:hypothetical protein